MRDIVFRILAAVLALLFAGFLIFADHSDLSWFKLISFWVVTIVFAVFIAFGTSAAEQILTAWFGLGSGPTQGDDGHKPRLPK